MFNSTVTTKEADNDQSDLLVEILNFKKQVKTEKSREKTTKRICF